MTLPHSPSRLPISLRLVPGWAASHAHTLTPHARRHAHLAMEYAPYASDADEAAAARAEELEAAAAAVSDDGQGMSDGDDQEGDAYEDEDDDEDADYFSEEDGGDDVDEAALLAGTVDLPGRRRGGRGGAHVGGGANAASNPAPTPAQSHPLFPDGAAAAARVAAIEALPGGRARTGGPTDAPYLAYKASSRRAAAGGGAGPGPSTTASCPRHSMKRSGPAWPTWTGGPSARLRPHSLAGRRWSVSSCPATTRRGVCRAPLAPFWRNPGCGGN